MYVLDTNVASELMRPWPESRVAVWIAERNAKDMFLTAISEAELRYGVAIVPAGRRRNELEDAMARWLSGGLVSESSLLTATPPGTMRISPRSGGAQDGPSERPTAKLRPYPARVAPSL